MKKCSFCGKEIKNSDKVCPHCFETQNSNNIIIAGILIFIIIISIILIFLMIK